MSDKQTRFYYIRGKSIRKRLDCFGLSGRGVSLAGSIEGMERDMSIHFAAVVNIGRNDKFGAQKTSLYLFLVKEN